MRSAACLLALITLVPGPLVLHGQSPSQPDKSTKNLTTIDMQQIASKDFKEADEELNRVYKRLLSRLDGPGQIARLRSAQRAWLKYRDLNADFQGSLYEGGSIRPQIETYAMTEMTKNRTKELQSIITNNFDR